MTPSNIFAPVRTVVLVLCAIGTVVLALAGAGVIGPASAARVVGIVLGAVPILILNFLRKTRPVEFAGAARTAFVGFLVLYALAGAITELAGIHIIGPELAARGGGIVLGAMAILTGNFLPKTRPLETAAGGGPRTRAVERAIGWILVLVGVAFVVMFAFAPLARAKPLAAAAGIGALLLIGATSAKLVVAALLRRRAAVLERDETAERSPPGAGGRGRLMVAVLVSVLYVLATACTQYLFAARPLGHAIGSWVTTAAGWVILCAILVYRGRIRRE